MRKELIRPHEAIEDTFRFRHMLIRDAAYDRVPKAQRADLHERFAGWLDGRDEEFEEIVGYHLEQAHGCLVELGPETDRSRDLATRAGRRLAASGRRAYDRGDLSAAADLFGRAGSLLPDDDPDRLPVLPMFGRALTDLGEWEQAKALFLEAIEQGNARGELAIAADASVADLYLWLHSDPQASHEAMKPKLDEAIGSTTEHQLSAHALRMEPVGPRSLRVMSGRSPAGDGLNHAELLAACERRLDAVTAADVDAVDVDVDEAAQLAALVEEHVLDGQRAQRLAHLLRLQLEPTLPARLGREDRGQEDGHSSQCASTERIGGRLAAASIHSSPSLGDTHTEPPCVPK